MRFRKWWLRLIEPDESIREPEQRWRSRLLNAVSLAAILFAILAVIFTLLADRVAPSQQFWLVFIEVLAIIGLGAAYALSRSQRFEAGAALVTATMLAATYLAVLLNAKDPSRVAFLVEGIIICSLFLSWRATAIALAGCFAAILLLPVVYPAARQTALLTAGFLVVNVGVLMLLSTFLRDLDRVQIGRQNRALIETSERLKSIMQSAVDGIVSFNERGFIVGWNAAAESMFGLPEMEALGRPVTMLVPTRLRSSFAQSLDRLRSTGQAQTLGHAQEFTGLTKEGAEFVLELSLAAWMAEGQVFYTGFFRDITERRQAQEELETAHEQLQSTVRQLEQRTQEAALLADMGELLQACTTPEEAYAVIANSVSQIFPGKSGELYLINPSRSSLESAVAWGGQSHPPIERSFAPEQCWGLRRGRLHVVADMNDGLLCRHLGAPLPAGYLCAPMIAQGESLGILHISHGGPTPAIWDERLALRTAEHIGLALANIRLRETLRSQSIRDPLTELFNRRFLEETLTREIRRSERSGRPLSVIMLDLDRFKSFNDRFGHAAGDAVLRALGTYLTESFRGGDVACRYGGEEFIVLLPETGQEEAYKRAVQLGDGIRRMIMRHRNQPLTGITASMGVAAWQPGLTADALVRAADGALYEAKAQGRDRAVRAAPVATSGAAGGE